MKIHHDVFFEIFNVAKTLFENRTVQFETTPIASK